MPTDPLQMAPRRRTSFNGGAAFLFPGQGSQVTGMRDAVRAFCPDLLELAERLVGCDLFAGADTSTRLLQPAIYCSSLAGWRQAAQLSPHTTPVAHAGHSLGEIAALATAGALTPEEGLRLVVLRGELMEQAAAAAPCGEMLAVLGVNEYELRALVAEYGLAVAADNAPRQYVLTGDGWALARLAGQLENREATCVRLAIKGAFHSPAMEPIRQPFERAVAALAARAPQLPVYSSVTARPFDDIPRQLAQSLTHTVRWRETMLALDANGASRYLDVGPSHVLSRLVKRTLGLAPTCAVETWDGSWTRPRTNLNKEAA